MHASFKLIEAPLYAFVPLLQTSDVVHGGVVSSSSNGRFPGAPAFWTTSQAEPASSKPFECVQITDREALAALRTCLHGNGVGDGGKDQTGNEPYNALELQSAWRIENRSLWQKYTAERATVQRKMEACKSPAGGWPARDPNIRQGLKDPAAELEKKYGDLYAHEAHECFLYHGLGDPKNAASIAETGVNEHFSGTNAGTM